MEDVEEIPMASQLRSELSDTAFQRKAITNRLDTLKSEGVLSIKFANRVSSEVIEELEEKGYKLILKETYKDKEWTSLLRIIDPGYLDLNYEEESNFSKYFRALNLDKEIIDSGREFLSKIGLF